MSEPKNVYQSELAVLGSVFLEPETLPKVLSKLKPEDFVGNDGLIEQTFDIIVQLCTGGKSVDPGVVIQAAQLAGGKADRVSELLATAMDSVTHLDALEVHVETVEEASKKRRTTQILEEALKDSQSWELSTEELWDRVNQSGFDILRDTRRQTQHIWTGGGEEHGLYSTRMRILREKETIDPLYSGWNDLDSVIPTGWNRSDVSVIAARPGMGKSSWRQNLQRQFLDRGFGGILISTEQSKEVETDRQDSIMTQIPLQEVIQSATWEPGDRRLEIVKQANQYMDQNWNFDMLFGRQLDMTQVWEFTAMVTRQREKHWLMIDLFDRLTDVNVAANKAQQVSKKLGEASALALYFNIHVCLIVQINRSVERRANKRPMLSDLKDSGNYEEAARMVLLLYRDSYYNTESLDNTLEVNVAKQNQGESGPGVVVPFDSNLQTMTYAPQSGRGI